jgi:hypothetical protein
MLGNRLVGLRDSNVVAWFAAAECTKRIISHYHIEVKATIEQYV